MVDTPATNGQTGRDTVDLYIKPYAYIRAFSNFAEIATTGSSGSNHKRRRKRALQEKRVQWIARTLRASGKVQFIHKSAQQTHPFPCRKTSAGKAHFLYVKSRACRRSTRMYLLVVSSGEDFFVHHFSEGLLIEQLSCHFDALRQRRHVLPGKIENRSGNDTHRRGASVSIGHRDPCNPVRSSRAPFKPQQNIHDRRTSEYAS